MPTFAAEDGFVVCRRAVVAPRVLLAEPFGRFGVRVVALRVVPPEPVSLAALDLLRGRSAFAVPALGRRGLLFWRGWASAALVGRARVEEAAFLGFRAVLTRLGVLAARLCEGWLRARFEWLRVAA